MAWTDEQKAAAIKAYKDAEPTAENSAEIVQTIADDMKQSPNGVRMILVTAGAYVKKDAAAAATKGKATADGKTKAPRVSKEDQIAALRTAIEETGAEVDEEVLTKLTGKAALYFLNVLTHE